MRKFERASFDAYRTHFVQLPGGELDLNRGKVAHCSKTRLTGGLVFCLSPGEQLLPGYRRDAIPARALEGIEPFVLFSGHGSRPEDLTLIKAQSGNFAPPWAYNETPVRDDGSLGYAPDEVCGYLPPWWAEGPLPRVWTTEPGVAWGVWRVLHRPLEGHKRHGLVIGDQAWGVDRLPFCRTDPPLVGWLCEPNRGSRYGRLLHRDGREVVVMDWTRAMETWRRAVEETGAIPALDSL